MSITRLEVHHLRNLRHAAFSPSSGVNLIWGENGSGKTSLLEAIHMLSVARSFRTHKVKSVISQGEAGCTLFARIRHADSELPVGITRRLDGDHEIRVGSSTQTSLAELARVLPLLVINPDAFRLLEGSPAERRQFMDWGVFHQENQFYDAWRRYQRALKQRNSLLKCGKIDPQFLAVWTSELVLQTAVIHALRQTYLERFAPVFQSYLSRLTSLEDVTLHYYPGWDAKRDFEEVLASGIGRDAELGFTQQGPHRADIRIKASQKAAVDILSRGQQKMVVCALKLAQGQLLAEQKQRQPVYLIDDLPAELDRTHRRSLCELIEALQCQVFITSVDAEIMDDCWSPDCKVQRFQMENGCLQDA
ncbi:DNA replication/repair protein RecF [Pokkaliibacter sp. CJK22405]|uniref:DNA replication/repair protein RecF n=1 Tax=Pokkaliibacter sp. CJK22405 TaxID=3384615 RepID=UPI003984DFFC